MIIPGGLKGAEELAGPTAGKWTARIWYHSTDKRFSAWGRFSKFLVPKLAARIATGISVIGWGFLAYETYNCIKECQEDVPSTSCKNEK